MGNKQQVINKQRVKRIKKMIYFLLVLVFLSPAIIALLLFFRMQNLERTVENYMQQNTAVLDPPPALAPGDSNWAPDGLNMPDSEDLPPAPPADPDLADPDLTDREIEEPMDLDLLHGSGQADTPDTEPTPNLGGDGSPPQPDDQPGAAQDVQNDGGDQTPPFGNRNDSPRTGNVRVG